MASKYCTHCEKETPHKYITGWGTLFAVLLTAGWWLLAISIYYRRRCVECGNRLEWRREYEVSDDISQRMFESFMVFLLVVLVNFVIIISVLNVLK